MHPSLSTAMTMFLNSTTRPPTGNLSVLDLGFFETVRASLRQLELLWQPSNFFDWIWTSLRRLGYLRQDWDFLWRLGLLWGASEFFETQTYYGTSELNTFTENVVIILLKSSFTMLITGKKELCGVFGWNIAQESKIVTKMKNRRKNINLFLFK